MVSLSAAVFAGLLLPGPATEDAVTVNACRTGDLTVRVWVRRKASLATPNWLGVEFVNTGREPVSVYFGNYSFDQKKYDLASGRLLSSSGLVGGSERELFDRPGLWIPPGTADRFVRAISDGASGLGIPPRTGWRIRASFNLNLVLRDKRKVQTPPGGVPFEFEWHHPGDAAFPALNNKLRRLLREPKCHAGLLATLLNVPEVGGTVTGTSCWLPCPAGRGRSMAARCWCGSSESGTRKTRS